MRNTVKRTGFALFFPNPGLAACVGELWHSSTQWLHAFKDGDAVDLVLKCPDDIRAVKPIQEEDYKEPRWVDIEADGVDETLLGDDGVAHDAHPKDVN